MPNLVPQRTKQEEVRDVVRTAANNNNSGITVNLHHRLAAKYTPVVSRRQRQKVMGDPFYYCEILPTGPATERESAGGRSTSVAHSFAIWLIYQWTDAEPYAGSSQETFDNITENLNPQGVAVALRDASHRSTPDGPVVIQGPTGTDYDLQEIGHDGGGTDTVHVMTTTVTVIEPN